jgi:hypothetical protein
MSWPFNNPSSWADKVEVHNNERKTSTYFNQARIAEQLESTGRFAEQARPSITGETPAVLYPRLPASSPWSGSGDVGLSEPLGVEIDQQEPVGTPTEIERSLAPAVALVSAAAGEAEPVDPSASSPEVDRGSADSEAAHARLRQLMLSGGLVRKAGPQVRRRKL